MEPAQQYSLTHAKSAIEAADWISGDHRIEGVIVAAGPAVEPFKQQPLLIDMASTILAALGTPASIHHTGRVLHEVVGLGARVETKAPVAIPGMPTGETEEAVSDAEADEMGDHLRGFGTSIRLGNSASRPISISVSALRSCTARRRPSV